MKGPGYVGQDSSVHDLEEGTNEPEQLKRNMGARHINMIAIAGMIVQPSFLIFRSELIERQGTGLFLSSGKTIAKAGPAGALLAYIFMGLITAGVSYTTGEITAFMPVTGGFVRHATAFIEPALGAATGWNFWYTMAISVPAELSAAATLIQVSDIRSSETIFPKKLLSGGRRLLGHSANILIRWRSSGTLLSIQLCGLLYS